MANNVVFKIGTNGNNGLIGAGEDDVFYGQGGNDVILGRNGDDVLDGGSGNDKIRADLTFRRSFYNAEGYLNNTVDYDDDVVLGGTGNDTAWASLGRDYVDGGAGNDLLFSDWDGGSPPYDALVPVGATVDQLNFSAGQFNTNAADVFKGGTGADTFVFRSAINASKAIVAKHTNNGVINWGGVAGENGNRHDHWVDGFGYDRVMDFSAAEGDKIRLVGHTVAVTQLADTGNMVSLGVYSDQGADGRRGNGAHDFDVLGRVDIYYSGNFDINRDVTIINNNLGAYV